MIFGTYQNMVVVTHNGSIVFTMKVAFSVRLSGAQ
jgi:hypothetical protein